jgi:hypothetical protein
MMGTGWIKESDNVYTQGVYYQDNHALIAKKFSAAMDNYCVILRNTFTGKEQILTIVSSIVKARKYMKDYMKLFPVN